MGLERVKQLSNEYAEQHIISNEQFEKFQERLYSQEAVVPDPCYREICFNTEHEAVEACKLHQEVNEYDNLPKVVKEFEL